MARPDKPRYHGFLIVDKPAGMTSHDVVNRVRRLTGQRTVGHVGTLDPSATGVLPVALGLATKALAFAGDGSKTYRAEITFGIETDSYDADGTITRRTSNVPSLAAIEEGLPAFLGHLEQVPPMHSAVQIGGRRLYELAREGIEVERPRRPVVIHEIEILGYEPPVLDICVDCGAGTYIRSLAFDLGRDLGASAYLSNLVRLRSGPFCLDDAWTLEQLAQMPLEDAWPVIAYHPDVVLSHLPAAILDEVGETRWRLGQTIQMPVSEQHWLRVYSLSGHWIGIGETSINADASWIQPRRVVDVTPTGENAWGQRER